MGVVLSPRLFFFVAVFVRYSRGEADYVHGEPVE